MEPTVHFLVPILILLAVFPEMDKRLVLLLSPLTLIPEIDFLIGHRYLFHNIFFALIVPALVCQFFKEKRGAFLIALFFLGSHLLLDISGPGVGLFYPFYNQLIKFDFYLYTSPATGALSSKVTMVTYELLVATKDQLAPIVTTFGIILIALIFIAILIKRYIAE